MKLLILLFYGLFAHTLYRFYWLFLFAMQAVLAWYVRRAPRRAPAARRAPDLSRPAASA
jgi:hypothetical protein